MAIYSYSGTGNSLWTARTLAAHLGDEVVPMHRLQAGRVAVMGDRPGIVFPVHMWGVPAPVLDFVGRMDLPPGAWLWAVAVNAGQVSRTLVQLQEVLAARGVGLQGGWSVVLPSNYLPWGGPGPEEDQRARIERTRTRLAEVAGLIREGREQQVERGPLWQRALFTRLYHLSFPRVPGMDKDFWVDDKCNGCGTCATVCPAGNIAMNAGRPTWRHACEQCLACIQWCPRQALQYGKRTPAYARYHHPEVKLSDMRIR